MRTAKITALREQTIIIEDCTAEIKALLSKSVFGGVGYFGFIAAADSIIQEAINEIEDEELKESAERSLKTFARKEFSRLRASLLTLPWFSYSALYCVKQIYNSTTAKAKQKAFNELAQIVPELADEKPIFSDEPGIEPPTRWGLPLNQFMDDYMKKIDSVSKMLAEDSVMAETGLPLRLKAELYLRQKWHEEQLEDLKNKKVNFVWTSSHVNCSPRCQSWQGKLYSLNHTKGKIGNISYRPLEDATDIYTTTKSGKRYKNGIISGFGCRHYLIPFEKNGERPTQFSDKQIDKYWEIDKTQRAMERKIYHLRESYYAYRGQNDKLARQFYREAVKARNEYIAFCKKNNVAYYPSRMQVKPS